MTIKEIADRTNLSVATISRVINNSDAVKPETRERVIKFLEESKNNYKYYAAAPNKTIALIIPDIHNPFYGEIIRGITRSAHLSSYDVLLFDTQDNASDEIAYLEKAFSQKVDGIILMSSSRGDRDERLKQLLAEARTPIVLIDKEVHGVTMDGVFLDDSTGMVLLTETLVAAGHSKIVLIAGEEDSGVTKKRVAAFKNALREFNLPFSSDQVIFASYTDTDVAVPILSAVLGSPDRPTAIITCNGLLTMTAIKCIRKQKLTIGKDIALVSFDEVQTLRLLGIDITSASVDLGEMGKTGFDLLMKKIDQSGPARQKLIMVPSVVKRGSETLSAEAD
jgi:LacI family transcriptional regulator